MTRIRFQAALRATLIHLLASLVVAALAALLVFGVWYPYPYRELAGGTNLFALIVIVDVICGPLLTLFLFNPRKSRRELSLDLGLVALIQVAALAYGLYSLAVARPVFLVFEVDRFTVVSVADVSLDELDPANNPLHRLSWSGPRVIGVREPSSGDETLASLDMSLKGIPPSMRPDWWEPYESSRQRVLNRSRPVDELRKKSAGSSALIDRAVKDSGVAENSLRWLPLTGFRSTEWVAFIDSESAAVRSFAPVDGF